MAWGKAGSTTLGSAGDDITVTIGTTSKSNTLMCHGLLGGSGTVQHGLRFDGLSSSIYSARFAEDGLSDVAQQNQSAINCSPTAPAVSENSFMIGSTISISGKEKLFMGNIVFNSGNGTGSPSRAELTGKSTDTTVLDSLSVINQTAGSDFSVDSNVSVLGSDITTAAAIPFAENAQLGSRAEITDTRKMYHYNTTGDVTTDGSYTVLKYRSDGTFTPTSAFNVEYLVVAGGGAGGASGAGAGGGGAGGYRTSTSHAVTSQSYNITVGAGGAGYSATTYNSTMNNGSDSVFDTITSTGGGGGSGGTQAGANGGSGGGGDGGWATAGGISSPVTSPVQGYAGGAGAGGSNYGGGGGGGSSAVGISPSGVGGTGGAGTANNITGTNIYYGGGGGGGYYDTGNAPAGSGGSGGGGDGGFDLGSDGVSNTGGGGGGSGRNLVATTTSGSGGSGIVIIRFLTSGNTYTTSLSSTVWTEEGT
tara:strand:+ start:349 stop:1776 length:1428 start_codon:yes stop_codon:yes gene_type:complete